MKDYEKMIEELDRLTELLLSHKYRRAKTAKRNPHWYSLQREWENDADYNWVAKTIEKYGKEEWFWRKPYMTYELGEFKYWIIGDVLNRTYIDRDKGREVWDEQERQGIIWPR